MTKTKRNKKIDIIEWFFEPIIFYNKTYGCYFPGVKVHDFVANFRLQSEGHVRRALASTDERVIAAIEDDDYTKDFLFCVNERLIGNILPLENNLSSYKQGEIKISTDYIDRMITDFDLKNRDLGLKIKKKILRNKKQCLEFYEDFRNELKKELKWLGRKKH